MATKTITGSIPSESAKKMAAKNILAVLIAVASSFLAIVARAASLQEFTMDKKTYVPFDAATTAFI